MLKRFNLLTMFAIILMFANSCKDEDSSKTVTDIEGNVYHTVTIDTQTWMVENLKTTKYNDGTSIPLISDSTAWSILATPGYCWYNNDLANKNINGALYNWYTVNTNKLAPTGWHVPTDAEWTTLTTYLTNKGYGYGGSGNDIAKSMASTTGWDLYSTPGTIGNDPASNNRSGFTVIPGGYLIDKGTFEYIGYYGSWWSSTEYNTNFAWDRYVGSNDSIVNRGNDYSKKSGFSVRCLRDY